MERRIREIREDFALPKIAYNLVTVFQRTCLPQEWQSLTLGKLPTGYFRSPDHLHWQPLRELTFSWPTPMAEMSGSSPLTATTMGYQRLRQWPCSCVQHQFRRHRPPLEARFAERSLDKTNKWPKGEQHPVSGKFASFDKNGTIVGVMVSAVTGAPGRGRNQTCGYAI
jgi:hypothetical protein